MTNSTFQEYLFEDLLIKVECGLDVLKSKLNQEEKQNEKVSN